MLLRGLVHQGLVCLMQILGDGDHCEQGGHEAGHARSEHKAVGEEGGHPHTEAELARQELSHGPPQAFASGLLIDLLGALLLLEFGERGAQGARYRILGTDQAQLVGRHPEQHDVLSAYPFRYGPAPEPGYQEEDGEDEVESPGQNTIGGQRYVFALLVPIEDLLRRPAVAHDRSSRNYALRVLSGYPLRSAMPKHASRTQGAVLILHFTLPPSGSSPSSKPSSARPVSAVYSERITFGDPKNRSS